VPDCNGGKMNIKIEATLREIGTKSTIKTIRKDGFIPAVIYGEGQIGTNIKLAKIDFQKQYRKSIGEVAIFDIELDGASIPTFIKDKQIHPVSREFVHIDFVELHKGKSITLEIPIRFFGDAKGIKEGGLLELLHHSIEISCLPKDLPGEIEIDVSNLGIGDSIHFKDVQMAENITANMSDITTLAACRAPKKIEEEVAEEDEEKINALAEGSESEEAAE
jgi:large subunit ribosomal protein L25